LDWLDLELLTDRNPYVVVDKDLQIHPVLVHGVLPIELLSSLEVEQIVETLLPVTIVLEVFQFDVELDFHTIDLTNE
jgi:hypothetical protein